MDTETLLRFIPPTISLVITSLFGLIVGVLVEKFKNRIRVLEYSIRTQKIIPPLPESMGRTLSIKLNDREVNTLKVATVEIENKNSIDLENIVVRFMLGKNSLFQGNEAYNSNNNSLLLWTTPYAENFQKVLDEFNSIEPNPENGLRTIPKELQLRIDFVLANRDYLIPVFNRKDKAIFNFLIEDPLDGTEAGIFVSIAHKSVKFIRKSDVEKQKQKDLYISLAIGIVVVSILIALLTITNIEQKWLIIWASIIGFSYSIVGYLGLHLYKRITTLFK